MQKVLILFFVLLMPVITYAQDSTPDVEPDWDDFTDTLYTRGDQTFIISIGTAFPVLFFNDGKVLPNKFDPPIGGAGSLAYKYYLNQAFFLGGELGVMFLPTISESTAFIIPLGLRGGWQFNVWRLEFPLSAAIGMVWHRYLNMAHYSMYLKAGAAGFFRATHNWSFGLSTEWIWLPQWTSDSSETVYGNVIGLTLSARYHF
jgi:hypothetical protein